MNPRVFDLLCACALIGMLISLIGCAIERPRIAALTYSDSSVDARGIPPVYATWRIKQIDWRPDAVSGQN